MTTSFPGSLFSRSRRAGRGETLGTRLSICYTLPIRQQSCVFKTLQFFWAFAAFFPAYVLTEALFVKRKVVIWVVVVSMEAIMLHSEVVWIEIISTLLLSWFYIPIRHGIFLNVFATICSTNSLVSSSLSPRWGRKRKNEGTSPYPSQDSLFTGALSGLFLCLC